MLYRTKENIQKNKTNEKPPTPSSLVLKRLTEETELTCSGWLFHSCRAPTAKVRSPLIVNLDQDETSSNWSNDLREHDAE